MAKDAVSSRISRDIVNLLVDRGMSQTQIAKVLGVTKSYVSRVRAGTRNFTLEHLAILENALGESLPFLLIDAIPRDVVSPELRPLYDSTRRLLETTGSGKHGVRLVTTRKRRARKRAA